MDGGVSKQGDVRSESTRRTTNSERSEATGYMHSSGRAPRHHLRPANENKRQQQLQQSPFLLLLLLLLLTFDFRPVEWVANPRSVPGASSLMHRDCHSVKAAPMEQPAMYTRDVSYTSERLERALRTLSM